MRTLLIFVSALLLVYSANGSSLRRQLQEDDDNGDDFGYDIETKIVGGSVAKGKDFEFMVNLGGCGGSLIAPDVVLTAAHCRAINPRVALIGGSTSLEGEARAIERGSATVYPRYSSLGTNYDLMLYKLSSPSQSKTPVRLNNDANVPSGGEELTVVGFGSTREGGAGSSFDLREVNVNHVPVGTCNLAYFGQVRGDTMFCAGVNGGGKDTCQGDSGGPIVDQNGNLVGITSWGRGCGQRGFPGVYVRISTFYNWIVQETCRLSDAPPSFCDGVVIPESDDPPSSNPSQPGQNGAAQSCSLLDWFLNFFSC